jgi:hypothetical protein
MCGHDRPICSLIIECYLCFWIGIRSRLVVDHVVLTISSYACFSISFSPGELGLDSCIHTFFT